MTKGSLINSKVYKCYVPLYNVATDYTIFEVGYEKCDPLHYWGPHEKNGYVFHYCKKGKGILKINEVTYNIQQGDIFYIAPDDKCFYQADKNDPWEYEWIYFGGMKAKSLIGKTVFHDSVRVVSCKNESGFSEIINRILDNDVSEINDFKAMSAIYGFFGWLLENYPNPEKVNNAKPNEKYWLQILNYIYINLPYNLSVSSISKSIGLERTYIYKLFLKNTGISTIEFIENLRISIACDKILEEGKSLRAIAAEVGFNDYAWFCRLFMRIVGVLPSEYYAKHNEIVSTPTFQIVQNKSKDYYKFFNKKN